MYGHIARRRGLVVGFALAVLGFGLGLGTTACGGLPSGAAQEQAGPVTVLVGETAKGYRMDATFSNPRFITTSDTAYPPDVPAIVYDVTIRNHAQEPLAPVLLSVQAAVGNLPAQEVLDPAAGFNGMPTTQLQPGKTMQFQMAFADPGRGDVTIELGALRPQGASGYILHQR